MKAVFPSVESLPHKQGHVLLTHCSLILWIIKKHSELCTVYVCRLSWEDGAHLGEGESTTSSFVVFIGALKLKVLPPNPPQHSSQLLLQLQFPATRKKKKKEKTGGEFNKDGSSKSRGAGSHEEHQSGECCRHELMFLPQACESGWERKKLIKYHSFRGQVVCWLTVSLWGISSWS